jgi:deoxycytidine triphosphate deaminase
MAKMVTGAELLKAVKDGSFIRGGSEDSAEGVKYDFRLSSLVLKARFGRIDASKLPETERKNLTVDPGEVVFVLTEESLDLPEDMIAQLSPKRKLSHAGLIVLGGFTIDPRYRGPLLVGLYNLSSTAFPLRPGKKLIAATFLRLEREEVGSFPEAEGLEDFPDELVHMMQSYQPVIAQSMAEGIAQLRLDLSQLKDEIRSHERWYERFKDSLERHNSQIGELGKGLKEEAQVRQAGEDKLSVAVANIQQTLSMLSGMAKLGGILIGGMFAVLLALLGYLLSRPN